LAIQIVVDNSGDSRFEFDPSDLAAVAEASALLKELTALGYTAAERTAPGRAREVTEFDPTATEVPFMPGWVGG
jgi:hypothetical protein